MNRHLARENVAGLCCADSFVAYGGLVIAAQHSRRQLVKQMRRHGSADNLASLYEIDDVIDPADSRQRIAHALVTAGPAPRSHQPIDAW